MNAEVTEKKHLSVSAVHSYRYIPVKLRLY